MQAIPPINDAPKCEGGWFRFFGMRLLLLVSLACGLGLIWTFRKASQMRDEQAAAETIAKHGGHVVYDNFGRPSGPAFLRTVLGENFFDSVVTVGFTREGFHVSDDDLIPVKSFSQLETLDISETHVTDMGLVSIEGLADLRSLSLPRTIDDSGLEHVEKLIGLKRLSLNGSGVNDFGLIYVAKLPQLEFLDLTDTQVGDGGLVEIYGLTRLKTLLLNGTSVTAGGVKAIQKALPNCAITWRMRQVSW